MKTNLYTLTVSELIESLRRFPQHARVIFMDDYGDRCHTLQALTIREVTGAKNNCLRKTAYSDSEVAINKAVMQEYTPDEQVEIVVLE